MKVLKKERKIGKIIELLQTAENLEEYSFYFPTYSKKIYFR